VLVLPPTFLKRTASGAHREKASSMNSGCKTNHCGAVCGVVGGVFAVRVLRLCRGLLIVGEAEAGGRPRSDGVGVMEYP
jgi:hypothetical protein